MICLTTTSDTARRILEDITAQQRWIHAVELRLDLLRERTPAGDLLRAVRGALPEGAKLICTVRRAADGGGYQGSETDRCGLLLEAIRARPDFVDLEHDLDSQQNELLTAEAGRHGVTVIRSLHDFHGVPEDLTQTLRTMVADDTEVAKVAVTPTSVADLLRLLDAADSAEDRPRIVIGMGPYGTITRVAPARFGSILSFCSVPHAEAAPGHLTPGELAEVYRVGEQRSVWPLFAVVGNPIAHSRSPHYHNHRFRESGVRALYVPLLVDDFSSLMDLAEALPVHGCSVTIPHKQRALTAADERSPEAQVIGAANTLVRSEAGWYATNTDVLGFLAPLEEQCETLFGMSALVLGAGGAARGVVYALARSGVAVLLWNRTRERAAALCSELAALPHPIGEVLPRPLSEPSELEHAGPVDLVVNTTSVGMHGDGDPAPWYTFRGTELVYDIVYTPPETPLINRAAAAGCRVITGDRMFQAQAAAQFELFRSLATGPSADG